MGRINLTSGVFSGTCSVSLIYDSSTSINPVSNNVGIFDSIFDETSDKSLLSRKLYQIGYEDKQDPQVFMMTSVLEIFLNSVFAGALVANEGSNCSRYVIWPLLNTGIVNVDELKFYCGEYCLGTVEQETFPKKHPQQPTL